MSFDELAGPGRTGGLAAGRLGPLVLAFRGLALAVLLVCVAGCAYSVVAFRTALTGGVPSTDGDSPVGNYIWGVALFGLLAVISLIYIVAQRGEKFFWTERSTRTRAGGD